MGIVGKAARFVGGTIVKAFRTVEHTTNATVYWIRDGARDTGTELRTFGKDFFTSLKRIDKKKAPWILYFIGFMSLVVATMYLMRLFDHFPTIREEMSFGRQPMADSLADALVFRFADGGLGLLRTVCQTFCLSILLCHLHLTGVVADAIADEAEHNIIDGEEDEQGIDEQQQS
jgi:hypothetical protein